MKPLVVALIGALGLAACVTPAAGTKSAAMPGPRSTAPSASPGGFDQTLSLQGVSFRVTSANSGSLNRLRIEPQGLSVDNAIIEKEIEGTVTEAEVADLNGDGSPEIYVYATSAGSGSYGSLVAFSANKGKTLSEIYLPTLQEDRKASQGYLGHDEFRVVQNTLVRRFPVYREKDSNAQPTGGIRQIEYTLTAGEAGWVLRPDRIVNY